MKCLADVAANLLSRETGNSIRLKLDSDKTSFHEEETSFDMSSAWATYRPNVVAELLSRRITATRRSKVIPFVSNEFKASRALLQHLEERSSGDDMMWRLISMNFTSSDAASMLKDIQEGITVPQDYVLLLLTTPAELKDVLRIASGRFVTLNLMTWIHPNAFDVVQEILHDQRLLAFAESTGLGTHLVFPSEEVTDVELRKLKYSIDASQCRPSSIHRAASFIKRLKKVLVGHSDIYSTWQVWNLFLTKQNEDVVQIAQKSPWLIGDVWVAGDTYVKPSNQADHMVNEVLTKYEVVDLYARAATKCGTIKEILVENRDFFSLEQHTMKMPPEKFPATLIIPANHGFVINLRCKKGDRSGAEITCGDDPRVPCVHSAFVNRVKRGLAESRKVLATINARRVKYVMERPDDDDAPGDLPGQVQRRLGLAAGNDTEHIPVPYRIRQKAAIIYKIFHDEVI